MDILRTRLVDLRESKNLSQVELGKRIGLNNTIINKIESGTRGVSADELAKFAEFYDVSSDYLLGKSDKRHYYSLTEKDNREVDQKIKDIMDGLDPDGPNFFKNDGNLSDHDKELLLVSLRQSYALARELAKKKYTPKKYRSSETDD